VLEHNRLDLVSLAAVTACAVRLVEQGCGACRDASEALALGRVLERAGDVVRAAECFRSAAGDEFAYVDVRAEALYRLGLRLRRERRYEDAAVVWKRVLELRGGRFGSRAAILPALRQFAVEQLAIHQEHRERDYEGARELTLRLLDEAEEEAGARADATRKRLARLDRKIAVHRNSQLFA
jgi:tetratricopeptide (TPR) repeat protein